MSGSSPSHSIPPTRRRARWLLALGSVLAAYVLREGWRDLSSSRGRRPSLDERFAPFVAPARGERRIGTLPDGFSGEGAELRRFELEYALAPSVLVAGTAGVRLVAAWAETPERLEQIAAKHRLRLVVRTIDGFVLFEKAPK